MDAGQILMHVRAPVGMRIEETAARFAAVSGRSARSSRRRRRQRWWITSALSFRHQHALQQHRDHGRVDGDIQISLAEGHPPTADYVAQMRRELPKEFPGTSFSFLPADIVSQILNFGAPAPIDLQVRGNDLSANFLYANKLLNQIRHIPGIADARIQQSARNPTFNVNIDRTRAQYTNVTAAT